MSIKDTVAKIYFSDYARIADLFNHTYGEELTPITAENVRQIDSSQYGTVKQANGQLVTDNRFQDLLFEISLSDKDGGGKVLFAVEIQSKQEQGMVFRVLNYNTRQYMRQLKYKLSYPQFEYLPVYSLVINLSAAPWKAVTELRHIFGLKNEILKHKIDNFHLWVLDPWLMNEKTLFSFCTDIVLLLHLFKNVNDEYQMFQRAVELFPNVKLEKDFIDLLNTYLKLDLPYFEKAEDNVMCKAVRDFRKHARAEGLKKGRAEGLKKGRAEGMGKGRKDTLKLFINSNLQEGLPLQEIILKLTKFFRATDSEIQQLLSSDALV